MRQSNPGLRNALKLLHSCAEAGQDGLSFSVLREAAGSLTSATASRLLQVLSEEHWIEHGTDDSYRLGAAAYRFANNLGPIDAFGPLLQSAVDQLAKTCQQSAAFTVWDTDGFRFRFKHEVDGSYPYLAIGQIGLNVFQNGFGLMSLAHQEDETIRRLCLQHDRHVKQTLAELREIAGQTVWQTSDIGLCFVAPIFVGKRLLGVLGVSCPLETTLSSSQQQYVRAVEDVARHLM